MTNDVMPDQELAETEPEIQPAPGEKSPAPIRDLYRVRVSYARGEALRYVSHLDMQLVWERALRRAEMPMAFSQGFSPRPRLHLASALPLGFLSQCELADFWLELPHGSPTPDLSALAADIKRCAPPGLDLQRAELVPLSLPALQMLVESAEYIAAPLDALDASLLVQSVAGLLAANSLPRERRGKPYDLRPLVEALEVREGSNGCVVLFMRLSARQSATGRPEEVLAALGLDSTTFRVERTRLYLANE